ncbi:MAG: malto-oligosyltrehalose trehalohydrolase, partial [Acidobacteriota bacterium]
MHRFGIWAPRVQRMSVKVGERVLSMNGPNKRGWWTLDVEEAQCGDDYAFLVNGDSTPYPDPRSLQQPNGV